MTSVELKDRLTKAQEKVAKCEATIERHKKQAEKKLQIVKANGFEYHGVSNKKGSKRPTVQSFTLAHREDNLVYVMVVANHLVTCRDGYFWDTWDSGDKSLYGYWVKGV